MTTFSNNLEKKDRFETGLKFFISFWSSKVFFNIVGKKTDTMGTCMIIVGKKTDTVGTCRDIVGKKTDTMGTCTNIAGKETQWVHTGT